VHQTCKSNERHAGRAECTAYDRAAALAGSCNPAARPAGFLKAANALSQKRDKEQRQYNKQNYDVCQCEPCAALCLPGKVVSISFEGEHSDRVRREHRSGQRDSRVAEQRDASF